MGINFHFLKFYPQLLRNITCYFRINKIAKKNFIYFFKFVMIDNYLERIKMQNQEIIDIISNLKGRKNYEEKKAFRLGFSSLYDYFEDKLQKKQ